MSHITNYDHCLRFQVIDKKISLIDDNVAEVVADNRGNICISIQFDSQWDGCGKTARFIYNDMWVDVPLNSDCECICPSEVLKKGRFSLGVYGADLKTTTPITVNVLESILSPSGGELPADPTPGVYNEIVMQYQATAEAADKATEAAWEAVKATGEALETINQARTDMENGGFITKLKELNKGKYIAFWIGTSKEYEELPVKNLSEVLYIITDEPDIDEIISEFETLFDAKLKKVEKAVSKPIFFSGEIFTTIDGDDVISTEDLSADMLDFSLIAIDFKYKCQVDGGESVHEGSALLYKREMKSIATNEKVISYTGTFPRHHTSLTEQYVMDILEMYLDFADDEWLFTTSYTFNPQFGDGEGDLIIQKITGLI